MTYSFLGKVILILLIFNLSTMTGFTPGGKAEALTDIFKPTVIKISAVDGNEIKCELQLPPICKGTNDDDIIIGTSLPEAIFGLKGNDNIQGNAGNDTIFGGNGDDIISGGGGFDMLFGQDGDDVIMGDSTLSLAATQVGDDRSAIQRLNELLLGVNSSAPFVSSASSAVSVLSASGDDLKNSLKNGTTDVFATQTNSSDLPSTNLQLYDGGKGDDHLIGSSANEIFIGGPGHDYFDCNEGIDIILDFNPKEDTANTNCEILQ